MVYQIIELTKARVTDTQDKKARTRVRAKHHHPFLLFMIYGYKAICSLQRSKVLLRETLIWSVPHVDFKTLSMTSSNLKCRRFAAVKTNHDFAMKQGLRFEIRSSRLRREISQLDAMSEVTLHRDHSNRRSTAPQDRTFLVVVRVLNFE